MPSDPQPDARSLRIWRNLVFSHSTIMARLGEELQDQAGLTLAQYDVLLRLRDAADGSMRMGELSAQVLVTTSGLSRVVDRLEAAGAVQRVRIDTDRRGVRVALTDAGRAALASASAVHRTGIERYFIRFIADDEIAVLERFFARLFATTRGAPEVEDLPMPTVPTPPGGQEP